MMVLLSWKIHFPPSHHQEEVFSEVCSWRLWPRRLPRAQEHCVLLLWGAWVRKQEESHLMVRLVLLCEREHVSPVRRHQHYRFLPSQPRRGLTGRYLPDAADKAALKTHEGCCACGQFRVFGSLLMIAFFFKEKYVCQIRIEVKITRRVWTF